MPSRILRLSNWWMIMRCGLPTASVEKKYMSILEALAKMDLLGLDPNGCVMAHTSYWQPKPSDPDPEQPGEKVTISSYLPTNARDLCPCASGKCFRDCCQPLPYWRPMSPNPGMQGYSLLGNRPPSVTSHRMMCTTYCKMMYGCIVPRISSGVRFGSIGESPHCRPLMEFSALGTWNSKTTALC